MQSNQSNIEKINKKQKTVLPSQISNSVVISTQIDQEKKLIETEKKRKKRSLKTLLKFALIIAIISILVFIILHRNRENNLSSASVNRIYQQGIIQLNQTLNKKYAWIKQKLDHTNQADDREFYQRIFVSNQAVSSKTNNPVFLYITQARPTSITQQSNFFIEEIKNKNGISLSMELRYFGLSLPFGQHSFQLQNLKYLSSQQMVEDIAFAIKKIIENHYFGITKNNQWIINGQRFSGTIVAWFRAKYPALTVGAIVSGPLLPTTLIPIVNENIYKKVETGGKKCKIALQKIMKNLQQKLSDDRKQATIYQFGQGIQLSAEEILLLATRRIDDLNKEFYLYNCQQHTESDLVKLLQSLLLNPSSFNFDPIVYSSAELSSREEWKYYQIVRTARAQEYYLCSQFGQFRVYSQKKSFCPSSINQTFFRTRCRDIFKTDLWPNPNQLVRKYDSYMLKATNLLIVHAFYDPYLPYGLRTKSSSTETVIKKCLNCQANFDYMKHKIIPKEIQEVFDLQLITINKWLKNKNK